MHMGIEPVFVLLPKILMENLCSKIVPNSWIVFLCCFTKILTKPWNI